METFTVVASSVLGIICLVLAVVGTISAVYAAFEIRKIWHGLAEIVAVLFVIALWVIGVWLVYYARHHGMYS